MTETARPRYTIQRFSLTILIVAILYGCAKEESSSSNPDPQPPAMDLCQAVTLATGTVEEITIDHQGDKGVFDPSIACDPSDGTLWMSYSAVDASANAVWNVSIRLAYSSDQGAHWQDAGLVSNAAQVTLGPLSSANAALDIPADTPGVWQSETSGLTYDPNAPVTERWKIIWWQYLMANNVSYYVDYAWIAAKSAATPQELLAATPVKWLTAFQPQAESESSNAPAYAPIAGPAQMDLTADIVDSVNGYDSAELAFCVFAEPTMHATSQALYVAMVCQLPITNDSYVIMLSCTSPCSMDNPNGWRYTGRIIGAPQAVAEGYTYYSAPDIAEKDGSAYLIVTPVIEEVVNSTTTDRYDGCRIFTFDDISLGTLLSPENPQPVLTVSGITGTHQGACTYHQALSGGIYMSQLRVDQAPLFRIVSEFSAW